MDKSTCILVLGTPRSGTSCVAGILHHLGVVMGEQFLEADDWNPAGYFQDVEFETFLELIDPFWGDTTKEQFMSMERAKEEITRLINTRNLSYIEWGLKSNRIIHFLEDLQTLTNLKVIRTIRPENLSALSWKERSGESLVESARVITYVNTLIDSELRRLNITPLEINFNELISQPDTAVHNIANFTGVEYNAEAVEWVQPNLVRFG